MLRLSVVSVDVVQVQEEGGRAPCMIQILLMIILGKLSGEGLVRIICLIRAISRYSINGLDQRNEGVKGYFHLKRLSAAS